MGVTRALRHGADKRTGFIKAALAVDVTLALNQRAGQLICIQITFVGVHMSGRFGQGADKLAALGYVAVVGVDVTGSAVKTGINTIIKTVVKSIVKTAVNDTIYGILDAAKLAGKAPDRGRT